MDTYTHTRVVYVKMSKVAYDCTWEREGERRKKWVKSEKFLQYTSRKSVPRADATGDGPLPKRGRSKPYKNPDNQSENLYHTLDMRTPPPHPVIGPIPSKIGEK